MTGSDTTHSHDRFDPRLHPETWHEITRDAVAMLRDELAEHRHRDPDDAEVALAGTRLRAALARGEPQATWVFEGSWLEEGLRLGGDPVDDEQLLFEFVTTTIEPPDPFDLDPDLAELILDIEPATWLRAVVGVVRAGAGSRIDSSVILEHVRSAATIQSSEAVGIDAGDHDRLAAGFDRILPAWRVTGLIDEDDRLTELGAWLLPRALADAWGFDFDDESIDARDYQEPATQLLALLEAVGVTHEDILQGNVDFDALDFSNVDLSGINLDALGLGERGLDVDLDDDLDLDELDFDDLDLDDLDDLDLEDDLDEYDEDEDARIAQIEQLTDDFTAWAVGEEIEVVPEALYDVLDLRTRYLDDQPTCWTLGDLDALFTEIAPPKLTMPAGEVVPMMEQLALFLQCLDSQGRLADGSDDLDPLVAWLDQSQDIVVAAMDDPSRWGPAKHLMTAAFADGVEPGDADALQAWIREFNQRTYEQRTSVLKPRGPAADLPVQVLAHDDQLATLVRETPVFQQVVGLLTAIGERLAVTSAGNLKVADARRLARELGTERLAGTTGRAAEILEEIPEPLRSSRDLPGLTTVVDIAVEFGLLTEKGRSLVPDPTSIAQMHDDPFAFWNDVIDVWVPGGVLDTSYGNPVWIRELNLGVLHILILLLEADRPVPIEVLFDLMLEHPEVARHVHMPPMMAALTRDVYRFVNRLAALGLINVRGVRRDQDVLGDGPFGGTLTTTPLTVALLHRVADLPVHHTGSLRQATATELLDVVGDLEEDAARQEMEQWLAARSVPDALAALSEAARASRPNALKAFAVFDLLDVDEVADTIESLAGDPTAGSFAQAWLVHHGRRELTDAHDADRDVVITMLATLADLAGPAAIAEGLSHLGDEAEQVRFLDDAWRSTLPETSVVLTAVGDLHPSKLVRKAGRKAAFKHRSAT